MLRSVTPSTCCFLFSMSVEFYGTKAEIEVRVRSIYLRLYSHIDGIIHQGQAEGSIRTDIRITN